MDQPVAYPRSAAPRLMCSSSLVLVRIFERRIEIRDLHMHTLLRSQAPRRRASFPGQGLQAGEQAILSAQPQCADFAF